MVTLTANRGIAIYSSSSVWASYASCSVAYSIPSSPIYPYSVYIGFSPFSVRVVVRSGGFFMLTLAGFCLAFCLSPEVFIFLASFSDILRGRGGDNKVNFFIQFLVLIWLVALLPVPPPRHLCVIGKSEGMQGCPLGSIKNFLCALCKKIFIALHFLKFIRSVFPKSRTPEDIFGGSAYFSGLGSLMRPNI